MLAGVSHSGITWRHIHRDSARRLHEQLLEQPGTHAGSGNDAGKQVSGWVVEWVGGWVRHVTPWPERLPTNIYFVIHMNSSITLLKDNGVPSLYMCACVYVCLWTNITDWCACQVSVLRHVVFNGVCGSGKTHCCNQMIRLLYIYHIYNMYIYKDNYGRLNMIGRERSNRALIGCDSQWNATRWQGLPSLL